MSILETIRETINRYDLIPPGGKVVIGVSGGADSVALARAFHQLSIPFTIAHLNHQLRAEADTEEQFVQEIAEELDLPMVSKSIDVNGLARASGLSIEMAARQARHDFFSEFEDATIALAHHADDQVETFLLKLARGAGSDGLEGMPFHKTLNGLSIIRPMLTLSHTEIIGWLEKENFSWCEDASNEDSAFLRNRVRHTILPLLEKELNPNIRKTLLRTMEILREENRWMNTVLVGKTLEDSSSLPLAARRRVLRDGLFNHGVTEVGFDAVDRIISIQDASTGTAYFELNDQQRVVVEYGALRVEQINHPPPGIQWSLSIESGTGWKKDHGNGIGILPAEASFDADKIGNALIEVRRVQPGDRISPLGMEGRSKLQDILTDQKIPRAQRSTVPVIVCGGEIIWVPGYRIARGWEVKGSPGNAIHVRVDPLRAV